MKCHQCGHDLSGQPLHVLRFCPHCGASLETPANTIEISNTDLPSSPHTSETSSENSAATRPSPAKTAFFAAAQVSSVQTSSQEPAPSASVKPAEAKANPAQTAFFAAAQVSTVQTSSPEPAPSASVKPAEAKANPAQTAFFAAAQVSTVQTSSPEPAPSASVKPAEAKANPAQTAFFAAAQESPTIKLQDMEKPKTPSMRSTMAFESSTITEVLSSMTSTMETGSHEGLSEADVLGLDNIVEDDGPILSLQPSTTTNTETQQSLPGADTLTLGNQEETVGAGPDANRATSESPNSSPLLPGSRIKVEPRSKLQLSMLQKRPVDSMFDVPSSVLAEQQRELTEKDSRVVVAYRDGMEGGTSPAPSQKQSRPPTVKSGAASTEKARKPEPKHPSAPPPSSPSSANLKSAKETLNMSLSELQASLSSFGVGLQQVSEKDAQQSVVEEAEGHARRGEFEAAIEVYMGLLKTNPRERETYQRRLITLWEEWRQSEASLKEEAWDDLGEDFTLGTSPLQQHKTLLVGGLAFLVVSGLLWFLWSLGTGREADKKKPVAAKTDGGARKDARGTGSSQPKTSLLTVNSSPAGAKILLNGTDIQQRTPASLRLRPGGYRLELVLEGFQKQTRTLQMLKNTNMLLDMNLLPVTTKSLSRSNRRTNRRRVKRKHVFLRLQSTPSGASLWINGRNTRKKTPVRLKLRPGLYSVEFRHASHKAVKRQFRLQQGQDLQAHVAMSQTLAQLEINSTPSGAQLWMNGRKTAYKTPLSLPVPTGKSVTIELRKGGYKTESRTLTMRPSERKTLRFQLKRRGPRTMVYVSGGSFWMGNNTSVHEKPMHKVSVSGFWMDRTEVTVAEYLSCVAAGVCAKPRVGPGCNGGKPKARANHPINCVNWYNAAKFCRWKKKRLPSEAQWEKAARGGSAQPYPWGFRQPSCRNAHFHKGGAGCGTGKTAPVASKPAGRNRYGLHDMAGNVWEWVRDYYSLSFYSVSPTKNPVNRKRGSGYKVVRGGSWKTRYDKLHMTYRSEAWPSKKSATIGFRCVR